MPKSAVIDEDETKGATVHFAAGENGINEALLKGYVAEIDDEQSKIDEIYAEADRKAQAYTDNIKAIKKAAAENGIPKKPLNAKLAERRDLRKAESRRETLSEDQREIFDEISAKLGDLPLFRKLDA